MNLIDIIWRFLEPTNFHHILTCEFVEIQLYGRGLSYIVEIWTYMITESLQIHQGYIPSHLQFLNMKSRVVYSTLTKSCPKSDFDTQFSMMDIFFGQHLLTSKIISSKSLLSGEHFKYPQCTHICSRSTYIQHFL